MNGAEPTCQQQRRLLLKQEGLEMTLEGAEGRIWCSDLDRVTADLYNGSESIIA